MPDRKASPKELEPETSTPLPFETGANKFSGPETSLKGDQTVAWDRALLSPFVPWKKLDAQPSETEIFQELIAEGTAYLLYQRMKEEADSELLSGWLFLKLQQSYYHNLVQNIYWCEQFLKDFPSHTSDCPTILLKGISLLNTVYQDPGLRHLGDIDLLIRKKDYPGIREKLELAGYVFSDEMQGLADPRDLNSILCHQDSSSTPPTCSSHSLESHQFRLTRFSHQPSGGSRCSLEAIRTLTRPSQPAGPVPHPSIHLLRLSSLQTLIRPFDSSPRSGFNHPLLPKLRRLV